MQNINNHQVYKQTVDNFQSALQKHAEISLSLMDCWQICDRLKSIRTGDEIQAFSEKLSNQLRSRSTNDNLLQQVQQSLAISLETNDWKELLERLPKNYLEMNITPTWRISAWSEKIQTIGLQGISREEIEDREFDSLSRIQESFEVNWQEEEWTNIRVKASTYPWNGVDGLMNLLVEAVERSSETAENPTIGFRAFVTWSIHADTAELAQERLNEWLGKNQVTPKF